MSRRYFKCSIDELKKIREEYPIMREGGSFISDTYMCHFSTDVHDDVITFLLKYNVRTYNKNRPVSF